jgi:hypothetical protein
MAEFLIVDPAAGRRDVIRRILGGEVAEHSQLSASPGQARSFKAAFLAWPECLPTGTGAPESLQWTCDHLVLMMGNSAREGEALDWCKRLLPRASPFPLYRHNGGLTVGDVMGALARIVEAPPATMPVLIGSSRVMREVVAAASRAAANDRPVLILGEPGTGKETVARWVHVHGERGKAGTPFEAFHCAGLEPAAAFSQLFGHEKGAFSWAVHASRGLLAAADGGVLYLHEICDLDKGLQFEFLRLLQQPRAAIRRLGGEESRTVNVRLMSASRWPLRQRLGQELSEELFYLLSQNCLELPPLRSRKGDIPELADYFVARHLGAAGQGLVWDAEAVALLERYSWPGNLNELEAVIRAAAEAARQPGNSGKIQVAHLPAELRIGEQRSFTVTEPYSERPPPSNGHPSEVSSPPAISVATEPETEAVAQPGQPPPFPHEVDCDGYRTIAEIRTTGFTRVYLAELKFTGDLVILKLLRPENQKQSSAMRKAITLHRNEREAEKFMVPIHHADSWSQFYLLVVDCLDNSGPGQGINRNLYRPYTFQHWLQRTTTASDNKGPREVIDHLSTMLNVLDFFHRNELVLNDIKPENFGFYRKRLVAIDYGGIGFIGEEPHEWNRAYGPQDQRKGTPAEDVFAVAQIMAQALYDAELELLVPEHIVALAKHYTQDYKTLFDTCAWTIIVKGLSPNPNLRYQDVRSMKQDLAELRQKVPGE